MYDEIREKVAYLQGLADGLSLDRSSKEGRLLIEIIDLLAQMADAISDLADGQEELADYIEEVDNDLLDIEDDDDDGGDDDDDDPFLVVEAGEIDDEDD